MEIAIVGAGVLGSIFGALFLEKGFNVTLVEVLEERVRLIDKEGLWLQWPDGRRTHSKIAITSNVEAVGKKDVVMIAVKGYHTRSAIQSAMPMIADDTIVLSVQNGLGNLEAIAETVGSERVVGGITAHSGMPVSMNEVRYVGGLGPLLVIGPYDGVSRPGFEKMVERFQAVGLDVHTTTDINSVIWKKLIANVSTNVVAALTGLTGGVAVKHEPTVKIIEALSNELGQVARAKGIDIPELDDPLDFSLKAFGSTKDNRVSMLQDVEAGRPTEIGNLNEVIVAEGRRYNIPTPYNEAVSWLTRGVEERNRQKRSVAESGNESKSVRDAIKKEDLEALRRVLEASPLARSLSIQFTEFEAGRATARLPGTAQLPNFLGYTHTGALFTLAEQTMAAAANSLGHVGLPLNCDIQFLNAADPAKDVIASARVIDTQGRIARVQVELTQDSQTVAKVSEMVFLRKK
ncbi:MAG: 2-dehydropantoate 2-reductase [Deltaproteobacteria bacterium]|jgi:2-dehydropantoate 2-reductase|nr:2-dehydropantoate 2-reductase [Deltaproteobacteria bacterium]MBW2470158.1 2-dehydropantoate 2-reductase [Deltaproteobacteria bacterium]